MQYIMIHADDITQYTIAILMMLSNIQVHDISELEKKAKFGRAICIYKHCMNIPV